MNENDSNLGSMISGFSKAIDELRKAMDMHFSESEGHFNRALLDTHESINVVKNGNNVLKRSCSTLEYRVGWSDKSTATHNNVINISECFCHRNDNIRIVDVKH